MKRRTTKVITLTVSATEEQREGRQKVYRDLSKVLLTLITISLTTVVVVKSKTMIQCHDDDACEFEVMLLIRVMVLMLVIVMMIMMVMLLRLLMEIIMVKMLTRR